jgi:hypothetical protein
MITERAVIITEKRVPERKSGCNTNNVSSQEG